MIAIIPARGGSKGLPGKNIKNLHGKPMIAYTIDAAKKSKHITDIIISTDNKEIADIAISLGALCHFLRPNELSTDGALAIDNYIYTIDKLNREFEYVIEDFIVLQPTSPLRSTDDIDASIKLFKTNDADSVISYVEESHPISWHKYLDNNNKFENIFPNTLANRQDNRTSYHPNGAIFIFKYNLITQKRYYGDNSYAYLMPRSRSVDVDTIEDFKYIEHIMKESHD